MIFFFVLKIFLVLIYFKLNYFFFKENKGVIFVLKLKHTFAVYVVSLYLTPENNKDLLAI